MKIYIINEYELIDIRSSQKFSIELSQHIERPSTTFIQNYFLIKKQTEREIARAELQLEITENDIRIQENSWLLKSQIFTYSFEFESSKLPGENKKVTLWPIKYFQFV